MPADVVVLVQAEFDVLEMLRFRSLRLYDEHCSGAEAKAICDLLARGLLYADGNGRLLMTDFGEAIRSSASPVPGLVTYRGMSQRVYTLGATPTMRASIRTA